MGNSAQEKSSLLVKNWVRLDNNTYRNAITEELIDEYQLESASEEAMQAAHGRLLTRANINHPNVIKLIYFCQDSQKNCCTNKTFRHRVFIEHQDQQLPQYLALQRDTTRNDVHKGECFCCAIANAFAYLAEKYGYFMVKDSMIFLVSQMKWHKSHDKKTIKVWINSELQECRPEQSSNQQEMCKSIRQVYDKIFKSGACNRIANLTYSKNTKWQAFLEDIYKVHDNVYQRVEEKKRVLSTYNSSNPTFFRSNLGHQSSQDSLAQIKTNRLVPAYKESDNTARNVIKTVESQDKRDDTGTTKKLIPTPVTRKLIPAESGFKQSPVSPFYRPSNVSKINFAYHDQFSTPKQTKAVSHTVNSTSPFPMLRQQPQPIANPPAFIKTQKNEEKSEQRYIQKGENKQRQSTKEPRLQRMTVNIMVECQPVPKAPIEIVAQPSQQSLSNKLAEILESQEHIPSSPFLIDVNQPQIAPRVIQERCAESINESDYERHDDPDEVQEQQILHYEYQDAPQIIIQGSGPLDDNCFKQPHIPLSKSIRQSEKSDQQQKITYFKEPIPNQYFTSFEKQTAHEGNQDFQAHAVPNFGSINGPPVLMHTSKHDKSSKRSLEESHPYEEPFHSASHSEFSRLNTNYDKYLQKFNQAMKPSSPRSKFSSQQQPLIIMSGYSIARKKQSEPFPTKPYNKYNSLNLQDSSGRKKSHSRGNQLDMSGGGAPKKVQSGQIESLYNESVNSQEQKKARIIQRIENTQKIIRENRKKLEKIELEKDLQRQKQIIKKEMNSLLKNNLMSDQSNRIKEKVKYKKATFAELKAEASKILEDLNF